MRDPLAERLLAEVMEWSQEDVARERPILQAMATYKYDEYQQFSPGMRFVESLALWLSQFKSTDEKEIAYEFAKKKLIFTSAAEMNHLVSMAYPDHIRPLLLRKAATDAGYNQWHIAKVAESAEFRVLQRRCLFLGLSDGARIDLFRRFNNRDLSHEQVYPTYEISAGRVRVLLTKLKAALNNLLSEEPAPEMLKFRTVVLLDDFSASGISYLRKEENGEYDGKVAKFYEYLTNPKYDVSKLIDIKQTDFHVVLYMATEQARQHLEPLLKDMWTSVGAECSIIVVHHLAPEIKLVPDSGEPIEGLIDNYYDKEVENEHTEKGGSDVKYGFAQCGLPLVLSHNTPNNSIALLWAETEKVRALFPRVNRHK
jgi:hypothetical protein